MNQYSAAASQFINDGLKFMQPQLQQFPVCPKDMLLLIPEFIHYNGHFENSCTSFEY